MPTTKHKLFTISKIDSESDDNRQDKSDEFNIFISQPNIVYVSHSIALATQPLLEHDIIIENINTLIISLIYRDLSETNLDVSKVSRKTKELIHKSIRDGDAIEMPDIETSFDKKLKNKKEDT